MGASAKALKIRIKSVKSTEHITRAMQLVASSKLRRATERMDRGRKYFATMQDLFSKIAQKGNDIESVYYQPKVCNKTCVIVIAGDRGLAGGYNNNVINLAKSFCITLVTFNSVCEKLDVLEDNLWHIAITLYYY